MELAIAGLVIAVVFLALALWQMDQRVAALEGLTGNAIQRALRQWFESMPPCGKTIFVTVIMGGAFLGMASAIGVMFAFVPFLLYVHGEIVLKWPIIFFLGGTGLYIGVSVVLGVYYHLRGEFVSGGAASEAQEKAQTDT